MSVHYKSYDLHIDHIAVERACYGDPVRLTVAEQGAAIRRLDQAGLSGAEISRLLRLSRRTVVRYRTGRIKHARMALESVAA